LVSADPLLFAVGAVHLRVALPVVGGGLLGGGLLVGGLLDGGLLDGGLEPEELPDEVGGLVEPDPEVPDALGGLLVALADGELEPEPVPQPARISMAAARPPNVFSDAIGPPPFLRSFDCAANRGKRFPASGDRYLAAKPVPSHRNPLDSAC